MKPLGCFVCLLLGSRYGISMGMPFRGLQPRLVTGDGKAAGHELHPELPGSSLLGLVRLDMDSFKRAAVVMIIC